MPALSSFFAIYTDGRAPTLPGAGRALSVTVTLTPMPDVLLPKGDAELFGPHARTFLAARPQAAWLLAFTRDTKGGAGDFFARVQALLLEATQGLEGFALDVLRLQPWPLSRLSEAPEDPFAEDLFSVGFHEESGHRFRAETFGLSKFGQRELTFCFTDRAVFEDAALLCAHLADYVLQSGRRVGHGQAMSFGYDRLTFHANDAGAPVPARGWHPPLVQRLLPEALFPGVGVLEVLWYPSPSAGPERDLTPALHRALRQREVLEAENLTGDSPHQASEARACACVGTTGVLGTRTEPQSSRDSGWTFACVTGHGPAELGVQSLGWLAQRVPQIVPYLALPPGCAVTLADGTARVDSRRAQRDDDLDPAS